MATILTAAGILALTTLSPVNHARADGPPPPGQRPSAPSRPDRPQPDRGQGGFSVPTDAFGDGPLNQFEPPDWGYRLMFPGSWIARTPEPYTVVVSGPEDSDTYYATVTIQNRHVPDGMAPETAARKVLDAYRNDLHNRYPNLRIVRETRFRPPANAVDGKRTDLPQGRQLVVEWLTPSGTPMRQWAIARPRPNAAVVHLWAFTADRLLFKNTLPIAESILNNWSLIINTSQK